MKKIYLSLLVSFLTCYTLKAQLTLTQASHEPIAGQSDFTQGYDSVGVVPKSTGNNQVWNFSSLVQNTVTNNSYYVSPSAAAGFSNFSGATIADTISGQVAFFKSSTNKYEFLGYDLDQQIVLNYTNPMTLFAWPISFGTTFSDTYAGTYSGLFSGNLAGSFTKLASGSGTLVFPGGTSLSNVLQLKTSDKYTVTVTVQQSSLTQTVTSTVYEYFHSSQKSPILTISYSINDDGMNLDTAFSISVDKPLLSTGIPNQNLDVHLVIFPNPAKEQFHIGASNAHNAPCLIEIVDATGRVVKTLDLGTAPTIDAAVLLNELTRGIYLVKLRLGTKTAVQRLSVE